MDLILSLFNRLLTVVTKQQKYKNSSSFLNVENAVFR
jgi:hypothetical protein